MYSCNHTICPGLAILFSCATVHKTSIFEKFVLELEVFSPDFKFDCILVWPLMSLNKKMLVSSGTLNIFIFIFIFPYSFNPGVGTNQSCKYFIAALIETIYFNFRLDIGITNLNDMDEFISVTKPMKGKESKIPIHPVRKNPKK